MSAFSDWTNGQVEAFAQGAGDVARAGLADVSNAYQRFLMADATIGPPEPVIGDMEVTHDPSAPEPLNDRQLEALIDEQEFQARMSAEPEVDTTPDVGMDMER